MAAPFNDVTRDIPGYKIILKSVLKSQIQHLVEQLAANTDEESVILTASVSDGTLSHLGSESGNDFLRDHEDIKLQFLGFCLKNHYEKRLARQRQETDNYLQDSKTHYLSNFGDENETYTATAFFPPQTSDSIHTVTSTLSPCKSPAKSPRVRFEPYMSPKRSRNYLYNLQQDRYRNHVFGQSVFNVPKEISLDEKNVDIVESSKVVEPAEESTDFPFSKPNLKTESRALSDRTLTKCESNSESNGKENEHESRHGEAGRTLEPSHDNANQEQNDDSDEATDVNDDNGHEDDTTFSKSTPQCDVYSTSSVDTGENKKDIFQIEESSESVQFPEVEKYSRVESDFHTGKEGIKTQIAVRKNQIKSTENRYCDVKTEETPELQNAGKECNTPSGLANNKGDRIIYHDNNESYVSRLRSSRSLQRKYEVNNALKLSKARRTTKRSVSRDHHAPVSGSLSTSNVVSNICDTSVANTGSKFENSELQQKNSPFNVKVENRKHPQIYPKCNTQEINERGTEDETEEEQAERQVEAIDSDCIKQETNSDSESELEITAIEPGSVFLFKDSVSKVKGVDDTGAKQKKVFIKRGKKPGSKTKNKTTREYEQHVFQNTIPYAEGRLCPPAPYAAKLRRFKPSVAKEKTCTSSRLFTGKCLDKEGSDRLPGTKLINLNPGIECYSGQNAKRDESYVGTKSETQISATQNVNSNGAVETDLREEEEPDSSYQSDAKTNTINRKFIDEDTPSPVSLSNSYMESEDYNDEMTSDSSVSLTRFSKFASGTHQTEHDPVSNKVDSNVEAKFERPRSELELQISHNEKVRTEINNYKLEGTIEKTLVSHDVAPKKGIRLAKHRKKHGVKKLKDKRKERKILKLGIKLDPETFCYTVAPSVVKIQYQPSCESRNQIPSMIFKKQLSLDSQMKSLCLSKDNKLTQSPPIIKSHGEGQKDHNEGSNREQNYGTGLDVGQGNRPEQKLDSNPEQNDGSKGEQNHGLDPERKSFSASTKSQCLNSKQKYDSETEQNQDSNSEQSPCWEPELKQDSEENKHRFAEDKNTNIHEKQPESEKSSIRSFKQSVYSPNSLVTREGMQLENGRKYFNKASKDNVKEHNDHNLIESNEKQLDESNEVSEVNTVACNENGNPGFGNKKDAPLSNTFDICASSEVKCLPSSQRLIINKASCSLSTVFQSNGITNVVDKIGTPSFHTKFDEISSYQKYGSVNANVTGKDTSFNQSVLNVQLENTQSQSKCHSTKPFAEQPLLNSNCMLESDETCEDKHFDRPSRESSDVEYFEEEDSFQCNSFERQENRWQPNSSHTRQDVSSDISVNDNHRIAGNVLEINSRSSSLTSLTDTISSTSSAAAATSPLQLSLSPLTSSSSSLAFSTSPSFSSSLPSTSPSNSCLPSPTPSSSSALTSSLLPSFSSSAALSVPLSPNALEKNKSEITVADLNSRNNDKYHILLKQQENHNNSQCDLTKKKDDCFISSNLKMKGEHGDRLLLSGSRGGYEPVQRSTGTDVLSLNNLKTLGVESASLLKSTEESIPDNINGSNTKSEVDVVPLSDSLVNSKYTCDTCGAMFQFKSTLTEHMGTHTGKNRHTDVHTEEELCTDGNCEISFTNTPDLTRPAVVQTELYISKKKRKKVQRKYIMENRSIFHRSKKPRRFTCTYCGRKYRLKSSLERHISCDHGNEICSKCHICGTNVEKCITDISSNACPALRNDNNYSINLNDCHSSVERNNSNCPALRTDSILSACRDDSDYSKGLNDSKSPSKSKACATLCENCKYLLKFDGGPQAVSVNKQIATVRSTPPMENESEKYSDKSKNVGTSKPSACDLCEKTFSSENNLKAHVQTIHYGELFRCKKCRKKFTMEASLKRHTREVHENKDLKFGNTETAGKPKYHCGLCGLPFRGSTALRIHIDIVHSKKRFKCDECKKVFSYEGCLKRHLLATHSQN